MIGGPGFAAAVAVRLLLPVFVVLLTIGLALVGVGIMIGALVW